MTSILVALPLASAGSFTIQIRSIFIIISIKLNLKSPALLFNFPETIHSLDLVSHNLVVRRCTPYDGAFIAPWEGRGRDLAALWSLVSANVRYLCVR